MIDYWKIAIREIDGISPPLAKLLHEQDSYISGKKITH